jgi:hypothetical protein
MHIYFAEAGLRHTRRLTRTGPRLVLRLRTALLLKAVECRKILVYKIVSFVVIAVRSTGQDRNNNFVNVA